MSVGVVPRESFGARLRTLRQTQGLSQAGLARRAGIDVDMIQRWEKRVWVPRWHHIVTLADALGVSIDAFRPAEE